MVEVSLTVGKLDASLALLLTKDHHLIEFPTILLPNGVRAGSIVKISCERDLETEAEEERKFLAVQDEILTTFGKNLPKTPLLSVKNVTQTSCVLEWEPLDLGTASLKSLTLFKDGKKLGAIPQPLNNRTTKLSGLPIEKSFKFQLKLDSTAGVYTSEIVEVTTHKMTDLSGIQVCLGDITPNEHFTVDDIQQSLRNMGAHHPASDKMKVETTHFVTTRENKQNPEFIKANDMNIPIIRPEWLKACERERRIVGVRDFYVKDCVLPDIFAKNYWSKPGSSERQSTEPAAKEMPPVPESVNAVEPESTSQKSEVPAVEISAPSEETHKPEVPSVETSAHENQLEAKDSVDESGTDLADVTEQPDKQIEKEISGVAEPSEPISTADAVPEDVPQQNKVEEEEEEKAKDMSEIPTKVVESKEESKAAAASEERHSSDKTVAEAEVEVEVEEVKVQPEASAKKDSSEQKHQKETPAQPGVADTKASSLEDVSL